MVAQIVTLLELGKSVAEVAQDMEVSNGLPPFFEPTLMRVE